MRNPPSSQTERISRADLDREIMRAVATLKAGVLGLVLGLISGVGLFAMTAILLIESGPNTGMHLQLISSFFRGYTVTWKGAFIGFFWAFAVGAIVGWLIGTVYNKVVALRMQDR